MYIPQIHEEVKETPLFSLESAQDIVSAGLFLTSLYFLLVEQNLAFFAGLFLTLAFVYHPHRLIVKGKYSAPADVII